MEQVLKVGVVGIGILGGHHSRHFQQHPNTETVAVVDPLFDRAEQMAAQVGAAPYRDYRDMLDHESLDLVVVATPDPLHRDPVVASAEAGVPYILTEKPMATTVADAEAMIAAVRKAGAKLWVHLDNRAHPLDIATRHIIQGGLLGRVVYGDVYVDDNISVPTRMWGDRSREWAASSSTAHFLFSHISDLMRWYLAPAEVEAVYAISQREVLGYTPDLYDGYLFFDTGLKLRIKSEWIKHVDGLVEFAMSFSGSEGTLFYHKTDAFGMKRGLRANVSAALSAEDLLAQQQVLLGKGVRSHVLMRLPRPSVGGDTVGRALEIWPDEQPAHKRLADYILDSILEDVDIPSSWQGNGRLPTGEDGLMQTRIVCAIEESARTRREVAIPAP